MQLTQLKINGFRCYESLDLTFDQRINVFSGANGAGKTSVLEAIYFLSTGKSFRSKRSKNLINHNSNELTVFAQYNDKDKFKNKIGVSLNKALKKNIKFNSQKISNQSEIAHTLPVVSIDPDSYLFLDKPPQYRRSFLDWLVFHVKPEYLKIWSRVSRCQKQLNTLYKEKRQDQLGHWEKLYIEYADQLTEMRQAVFTELRDLIYIKVQLIIPELAELEISFYQGWSKENTLAEQIQKDREKNLVYGNLNQGVHKMDIKNSIIHKPAHENLSRGQKKLISIIYYLSYIELLSTQLKINPILCLDDMDAELDTEKTKILCDFIQNSSNQAFISTVDPNKLMALLKKTCLFHVEHNQISRLTTP
ncbi:DNA recombination and repair protein RecF [hydrothermal vent metagenome]|uniref:DNA recombination and repair protein RecF n=1 Tax=hydrothermal vent metagenome TaxID=652676 RepID=A0A3B0VUY6_9ZZZZ